ncbi:MAG TPA: NAD(P)-dependent oxidoreductase [Polyangiaceae bacterium]|nr:NAD(P)-dependent oxidoreductase [Polyangiaceae bacterium]
MSTRVAVLGTGRMGSAIARRLAETGHNPVLWNRTRSRAESVGAGIVVATPAEAVAKADIVITSLTGPEALRATFTGPTGALTTAFGQTFVEMSTAGPDVLEELARLVARTGSTLVDAPLIGPPPAVLNGAALVIAGGSSDAIERVRPILERFGELRHVGPFGSGARLKLVANSMLGALILIAAELETAATGAGLDPGTTFDVLTRFVPSLAVRRAGYLQDKHEPTMFALRDLQKDLHLALNLFHRVEAHVPLTALVREWIDEAATEAADLDISAVIRRYARRPGFGKQDQRVALLSRTKGG